jgi:FecR protein
VKRRTPTPIPTLADAAVSRIERGLFAALDARPFVPERARSGRRRGLAATFALAGVAVAASAIFVVREGRRGEAPPARAQISTTTSGSRIAIAGATLEVAPQSAVSFGGGRDGAVVVVLDRGTVTCEVAPRAKRAPFVVEAGATRVTVIGTRFSVHRVGEHATVSVERGLVEVADMNFTELVHAGESYRPGEAVTRAPLASEAETAPVAPVVAPNTAVAVAEAPAAAPRPAPTIAAPVALAPRSSGRPARPRRLALADETPPAQGPATSAAVALVPRDEATGPTADVAPPASAADTQPAAQRRSVQVLFELAAQLEVRDPEAALRIYGELAGGASDGASDDGWAASALFAAARLEGERHQTARARDLCLAYLERFPHGPNADDARTLLAAAR